MGMVERLAAQLGAALARRGFMLVTAETFTGGALGHVCISVEGSTVWFDRGYLAYSERAIREMLGVAQSDLTCHGVVSEPVVRRMAAGALARSAAQVAAAEPDAERDGASG